MHPTASHGSIYGNASWYDLAFSYRDYAQECEFLLDVARTCRGGAPRSFLELAAGPANHAIEMGRRGLETLAVDRTPGMVAYGREKAARAGVDLAYVNQDIRRLDLGRSFDLAACMLVSWSYLLRNEDVLRHLDTVANHLTDGGVYVVELEHPRDLLTAGRSAGRTWEVQEGGRKVGVTWGQPDDPFDPVTQVREVTVEFRIEDEEGARSIWETSAQREFTANEVHALVQASGRFRVVDAFGSLDVHTPFDNARTAWRMVPVLQKVR